MWGVLDCVYIETDTYKALGGHVVGGWGDVSNPVWLYCMHVWIKQETSGA